jgi:hypothetical protein
LIPAASARLFDNRMRHLKRLSDGLKASIRGCCYL